jgi:predicted extracellular nuclease
MHLVIKCLRNLCLFSGAPALALEASNAAQTILLDDGSSKTGQTTPLNPIPYPAPGLSDSNTIRTGYTLTSTLNGDLSFGNSYGYLLEPINPSLPGVTFSADSNPRPTEAPAVGGRLKVVGMNLENFFTQLQGPSCSSSNCRGASTQEVRMSSTGRDASLVMRS